jgi:predicted nucleic acid-binding protein
VIVVDASVVVASWVGQGALGNWATEILRHGELVAPHLMPVEAVKVLRRETLAGRLSADRAALAHAAVVDLPVSLLPYAPFAGRVWSLRATVTAYDAWYVAIAEALGSSLGTLDRRLSQATGPRCRFELPPVQMV